MNKLKNIVEWKAFGVCSAIGLRMGVAPSKIRQFFMYTSLLTLGSPVILYLVLAFWKDLRKFMQSTRRNPWYHL